MSGAARPLRGPEGGESPDDEASGRETVWRRVALSLLLVVVLVAIASTDQLHAAMLSLTDAATPVMRAHPVWGALVFVLLSALSAMLAFFSGAVLVPVAVQVWGTTGTVSLLWVGWIVGGVSAYALARAAGRPLVARLVNTDALARYEAHVSRGAPLGLVILLQLGLPSEVPGYLLGLARYPVPRYLLALALAELPWAVLTVLLGTTLVERRVSVLVAVGAAAALLGGVALALLTRRLRSAQ